MYSHGEHDSERVVGIVEGVGEGVDAATEWAAAWADRNYARLLESEAELVIMGFKPGSFVARRELRAMKQADALELLALVCLDHVSELLFAMIDWQLGFWYEEGALERSRQEGCHVWQV